MTVRDVQVDELIALLRSDNGQHEDAVFSFPFRTRAISTGPLFNAGDYDLMPLVFPADHVHDMRPTRIPGMGVYRGREGYRRFIGEWVEAFPGAVIDWEHVYANDGGEALFIIASQEMHGGSSDIPLSFQFAAVAEYSDERHESIFGTDVDEMRQLFVSRYGQDPGP